MDLESLRAGTLTTTLPVDHRIPWVDPRDIGEIAVGRLLSESWSGSIPQGVHGPEDLSFADVADIVGTVIGREVVAQQVSDEEVALALAEVGMTADQVDGIVGMSRGLRAGFMPADERDVMTTTPTTLAAWSFSHLRPLLDPATA